MARALDDLLAELPIEKRKDLESRGQARLENYQTLQELRKSRDLTQEKLAVLLGINQENVSRLERRNDLLLSTLREYVEAIGGDLEIIARFPDREPVRLNGLLRDAVPGEASKE